MTDYKLVPVLGDGLLPCPFCGQPPTEYDQIGYSSVKCHGCKFSIKRKSEDGAPYAPDLWNRRAAPAVQGEPVSLRERLFRDWEGCSNHGCVVVEPRPGMARTNGSCQCVVNASRSQLYMLQGRIQSALSAAPQPAEQQPDVTQLVEALEFYAKGEHFTPYDPDQWDTVSGEPLNILHHDDGADGSAGFVEDGSIAKAAIAAHRKQGGAQQ